MHAGHARLCAGYDCGSCGGLIAGTFELYNVINTPNGESAVAHPGGLTRYAVMWPDPATPLVGVDLTLSGYQAKERIGWYVPSAVQRVFGSLCGRPDLGDYVWTVEQRSGGTRVALYDVLNKVQKTVITPPVIPSISLSHRRQQQTQTLTQASHKELYHSNPNFGTYLYDENGTVKLLSRKPQTDPNKRYSYWCHPSRDWPIVAGVDFEAVDYSGTRFWSVKFGFGPLTVDSSGVVDWPEGTRTYVKSFISGGELAYTVSFPATGVEGPSSAQLGLLSNMRWYTYDSTDQGQNYCGVLAYHENAGVVPGTPSTYLNNDWYANCIVIANGTIVKHYRSKLNWAANGLDNYVSSCVPFQGNGFHASHSGVTFLNLYDFYREPDENLTRLFNDVNKQQIGYCYGTNLYWQTQRIYDVACYRSSKRYLYLQGSELVSTPNRMPQSGWLPNEVRTIPSERPYAWIIHPDGSQSCPAGCAVDYVLNDRMKAPKDIWNFPTQTTFIDCIKNPETLEGVLPADLDDLVNAVKGVTTK